MLEKTLGAVGFMNIASVAPRASAPQESLGLGISEIQQRGAQEVTEGGVSARLYAGCGLPLDTFAKPHWGIAGSCSGTWNSPHAYVAGG